MEEIKKLLAKDPKLKKWMKLERTFPKGSRNITMKLVSSILSQQLSTTVARVMHERFVKLIGKKSPTAADILKFSVEEIKGIGISRQKASYIHNVAQFMVEHKVTLAKLNKMDDETIIELLTQIKGVGRWTVEMLLIFGMGREDVFAVDDLGIQKAMIETFKLQDLSKKELRFKMLDISKRWSPYRTYVCLHFWG